MSSHAPILVCAPLVCAAVLCAQEGDVKAAAATKTEVTKSALPSLAEPVKILAGDEPITVTTGHAAPFVLDFDRDGKKDLIVGQFSGGKARIYLNVGTDKEPRFADWTFLQAEAKDASVPPS